MVQALLATLNDSDYEVRRWQRSAWVRWARPAPRRCRRCSPPCVTVIVSVREMAAVGLGQLGQASPEVVQALLDRFV